MGVKSFDHRKGDEKDAIQTARAADPMWPKWWKSGSRADPRTVLPAGPCRLQGLLGLPERGTQCVRTVASTQLCFLCLTSCLGVTRSVQFHVVLLLENRLGVSRTWENSNLSSDRASGNASLTCRKDHTTVFGTKLGLGFCTRACTGSLCLPEPTEEQDESR